MLLPNAARFCCCCARSSFDAIAGVEFSLPAGVGREKFTVRCGVEVDAAAEKLGLKDCVADDIDDSTGGGGEVAVSSLPFVATAVMSCC